MKITQISQCKKELDFNPALQPHHHIYAIALDGQLISGFHWSLEQNCLNYEHLDSQAQLHLFKSLYHQLSFVEIARLTQLLKVTPILPVAELWQAYHYSFNQHHQELVEIITQLPSYFLKYTQEKQWDPQDFYILKSVKDLSLLENLFINLSQKNPSKSLGGQIFELATELLLLGRTWTELEPQNLSNEEWHKKLNTLRYQQALSLDHEKSSILKTIPSQLAQAKWVRRGDKAGVELKLFFSSSTELSKNILQLQKLEASVKDSDLWKS